MMSELTSPTSNPCLNCGACCATFRVSFYWSEAISLKLPEALTEQVNPWFSCMAGTNHKNPRCQALSGEIGQPTRCQVYQQRPSPCHELQPGEDKCIRARSRHGLPPLAAEWHPLTIADANLQPSG